MVDSHWVNIKESFHLENEKIIFDTSVFMERLDVVEGLSKKYDVLFPIVVADELNHLKESHNEIKSYKARQAIRFLKKHSEDWFCDLDILDEENDMAIVALALANDAKLVTLDYGMELRAKVRGVQVYPLETEKEDYRGYKIIKLNSDDEDDMALLAEHYERPDDNTFECNPNEYLIIKQDDETVCLCRWNGETHVELAQPPKHIKAYTDEQKLAIDLILNKDIPIKVIYGVAGSGKTMLSVKLGLSMIKDYTSKYNKIMLVRNPLGSGERIGFLKGDKYDKIIEFYKPFQQHFDGDYQEFQKLIQEDRLEIEVPYYMKGLDIHNTLVIFDEAEDSDEKVMRLVGTRIAEGSSLIILGDAKQAENQFSERSNGLTKLVERSKGSSLFGCVYLSEDLRSNASKMFVEIF